MARELCRPFYTRGQLTPPPLSSKQPSEIVYVVIRTSDDASGPSSFGCFVDDEPRQALPLMFSPVILPQSLVVFGAVIQLSHKLAKSSNFSSFHKIVI